MARDRFNITWGDTGTQPSDGDDFQSGEKPDAQHFDWKWYNTIQKINKLWDEFARIDSNDDGVVDQADSLTNFDTTGVMYKSTYDTDGDNVVDEADMAHRAEVRTNDPSSPADGREWIRSDL